jgi:hypothetical protein
VDCQQDDDHHQASVCQGHIIVEAQAIADALQQQYTREEEQQTDDNSQ